MIQIYGNLLVPGRSVKAWMSRNVSALATLTQYWGPYQKEATSPNSPWRSLRNSWKLPASGMSWMFPVSLSRGSNPGTVDTLAILWKWSRFGTGLRLTLGLFFLTGRNQIMAMIRPRRAVAANTKNVTSIFKTANAHLQTLKRRLKCGFNFCQRYEMAKHVSAITYDFVTNRPWERLKVPRRKSCQCLDSLKTLTGICLHFWFTFLSINVGKKNRHSRNLVVASELQ